MAKIWENNVLKKENKTLKANLGTLERKLLAYNKQKVLHALQLKQIALEMEALKVRKVKQGKLLKEKTNVLDHKRKLEAIKFIATTK
jgi:hypothetical protein